ncbi:hypothetical protein ACOSQ2_022414 [Xanthoceras sorbifolium]
MLLKMGFSSQWTTKIMDCVSTVFSFLRKGRPYGFVCPSRGLLQGCPLSSYLFLVCAEGLSALIRHDEACNSLAGTRYGCSGPRISHLFFLPMTAYCLLMLEIHIVILS